MNGVEEGFQNHLQEQTMASKETHDVKSNEKKAENADSDAESDPLVEIPSLTGNQEIRRSQISDSDIRVLVVRCTSCTHQINHFEPDKVRKHRRLNVIICKDCETFYGCSDFSQDENGYYNYCTWCGNGGKLYLCDDCPNGFCSTCVRRNFGRAEVSKMNRDGWKCYVCNPKKLKQKVLFYELIKSFSIKESIKKEKKLSGCTVDNKNLIASESWMTVAFDRTDDENKNFQKKINKLRNIETSHSKSLKHIVKKFEQLIVSHNSELKKIMKALLHQYSLFVSSKLKIDSANEQLESVKCKNEKNINVIDLTEDIKSKDMDFKSNEDISVLSLNETNEGLCVQSADGDKNNTSLCQDKSTNKNVDGDKSNTSLHQGENAVGDKSNTSFHQDKSPEENASVEDSVLNSATANEETEVLDANLKAKMALLDDSDSESCREDNILSNDSKSKLLINDNNSSSKISFTNTSRAENKAEMLNNDSDSDLEDTDDDDNDKHDKDFSPSAFDSDKASRNKKSKKKVHQKVKHLELDNIISSSDEGSSSEKSVIKGKCERKVKKKISNIPDYDDPKLKLNAMVLVQKCDDILNGETSIKLEIDKIAELEKLVDRLCKSPVRSKKVNRGIKHTPLKDRTFKAKRKLKESSSSISLSSSDESMPEKEEKKHLDDLKKSDGCVDPNISAKNELLQSDSESDALSSDSDVVAKKKTKKSNSKPKSEGDSSDDFQPRKKKYCKLLREPISFKDDESDTGEKNDNVKKNIKKSASKKRKQGSKEDEEESSDSGETTTSESENEGSRKRKKNASKNASKKKRQRIKKPAVSGSETGESDGEAIPGSQDTPAGKGRKNIKKIISEKNLAQETKEAQLEESERKKRVQERQKMYNVIVDTSHDGQEIITRKLVLEVDPVSKEEVVEVHPDLIEKLKPHQVNGVKFMWECTIESLKSLETKPGSGCILAHCMGLGKTLQVIAFLHTCLTNKYVSKKIKTAMVICPYNTVLNWSKEFDIWTEGIDDKMLVHQMILAKDNYTRADILDYWQREGGVLIISYDIFRNLVSGKGRLRSKERKKIQELLIDKGPDIVICDEGHVLKNIQSAISKATSQFNTKRRIVLTGTPLQNNLLEYHCMLSFVKPYLLGTAKEFRNRFVNPIMNGQYDDSTAYDVKIMKKRIHILHKLLDGCVQRCDYSALTKFLPPKHEFVISVKLSDVQIKMYRWYLENKSQRNLEKKQGSTLFNDYNVLRNLCIHPYICHTQFLQQEKRRLLKDDEEDMSDFINDDSESEATSKGGSSSGDEEVIRTYKTRRHQAESSETESEPEPEKQWYHEFISDEDKDKIELSGKMVLLVDIIKECEAIGDKIVVFSQSLLTLDMVEVILQYLNQQTPSDDDMQRDVIGSWISGMDYFRMDGSTSADFRKSFIERFNNRNNERARLFLISTKAGSLGTNLIGANRVVILDASWNPSHDVQAIFRVYRFGQTKPVYIYRLLAQGTMEEKIYDRQVTKLSLSIRVVDEQQIDRHFNAAELAELYTFNPDSTSNRPTPMVPNDRLLAEMLIRNKDWIVTYHVHDSLLQNETEEDLTEEERKAAWEEYENEREGRTTANIGITPGIQNLPGYQNILIQEPNFDEADYQGPIIPTVQKIMNDLSTHINKQCPQASAFEKNCQLLRSVHAIRAAFQEKHVKIIRMKQEFVSRGSVPLAVNKYLDELNVIIKDISKQYEVIYNRVVQDQQKMDALKKAPTQQPILNTAPQMRTPNPMNLRPGTYARATFGGKQYTFPIPRQVFTSQSPRFHFQTNPSGAPRMTPYPSNPPFRASNTTTPQPIVTENDCYILPDKSAEIKTTHTSSVTIEEIE